MILLYGIVAGFVLGFLSGGSLRQLSMTRLRFELLLIVSLLAQLVLPRLPLPVPMSAWSLYAWIATGLLSLAIVLLNIKSPGMAVVACGLLLNLAVVVSNGGMPVQAASAAHIGFSVESVVQSIEESWLHLVAGPQTVLLTLGDVIPIPGPRWLTAIVSLGDVLLMAGSGVFVFSGMHNRMTELETVKE